MDGADALSWALYGRPARAGELLGGSEARILHDAAQALRRPSWVGVVGDLLLAAQHNASHGDLRLAREKLFAAKLVVNICRGAWAPRYWILWFVLECEKTLATF